MVKSRFIYVGLVVWCVSVVLLSVLWIGRSRIVLRCTTEIKERGAIRVKHFEYVLLTGGSIGVAHAMFPEESARRCPPGMTTQAWVLHVQFDTYVDGFPISPPFYMRHGESFWSEYGFANVNVSNEFGAVPYAYRLVGFPLWVPLLPLVMIGPLLWRRPWKHWREWKRFQRGKCPQCGYDLRESNERCPECGRTCGGY